MLTINEIQAALRREVPEREVQDFMRRLRDGLADMGDAQHANEVQFIIDVEANSTDPTKEQPNG